MGRSTSCFKIMTCGGSDPAGDNDDELGSPEVKSDGRRWSFKKRSTRHRVLNNSVLSESAVENKEIMECIDANAKETVDFDAVEKESPIPCAAEKPQLSASSDAKADETDVETKPDIVEDEASIVIIQACIRANMAQKELLKLRKVVKMQALVRGHLVRRHAVGTLRCVQAIVKMQALVRTRYASRLVERSSTENDVEVKGEGKETYISIEKLLSNRFAQQLLDSKPKTKPIHINTSKTGSSWQWLERWMSISSSKQSPSMEASNDERISEVNEEIALDEGTDLTSEVVPCQPETNHEDTHSVHADGVNDILASAVKDSEIDETPDVNESILMRETENQISNEISSAEPNALCVGVYSEGETELPRHSEKDVGLDQLMADSGNPSFGSGRVMDPEVTAALSKSEEMTVDPVSSSYENVVPVPAEEVDKSTSVPAETQMKDNSASDNLLAHTGGSECGTELSISSTLDSPDRDEHAEKGNLSQITDDDTFKANRLEHHEDEIRTHHLEDGADSIISKVLVAEEAVEPEEQETEKELAPNLDTEVTAEAIPQHTVPSPEASPRSHMTAPESQGTPASQASVNTKGNKAVKSILSHKRKSLSAGKRSPSSPNQESASSNSREFPRDRKTTKRRSLKPEHPDQEPSDGASNSNSTGSIPHFMQATQSARAKLNANNSPRSSPDVHDREQLFTKKRHTPQVRQHGEKANGTQPQERKWIR